MEKVYEEHLEDCVILKRNGKILIIKYFFSFHLIVSKNVLCDLFTQTVKV